MSSPIGGGPGQTPQPGQPLLGQIFDGLKVAAGRALPPNAADMLGSGINALAQPPVLRTFVYAPEVKVVVAHNGVQYDVSSDVVRTTLVRPENSAASFHFTCHNKDLRYTPNGRPRFSRMDRVMVWMKKTGWQQVFSGYLDSVPYRQLYPGTVDFKATCTIKRLMHTWFNPDLPQSLAILNQLATPEVTDVLSNAMSAPDSGLGTILRNLLIQVGGWSVNDIHIQNFPVSFFNFLKLGMQQNQQVGNASFDNLAHMILGGDTSPGPGAYAGSNPNAGAPGPSSPGIGGIPGLSIGTVGAATLFYVGQIVAAADEKGLGPVPYDNNLSAGLVQAGVTGEGSRDQASQKAWQQVQQANLDAQEANRDSDAAILCVAAAMVETGGGVGIRNLFNPAVPGSDQFPNDGPALGGTGTGILGQPNVAEWGTVAQRMNPKQAAGMFFARLNTISGWRGMDEAAAIQVVQRNNTPQKYAASITLAKEIVKAYRVATVGMGSTVAAAGPSGTAAVITGGGAPSSSSNLVPSLPKSAPQPVLASGAASAFRIGKPQPDSEGAINWAMTQLGKPYVWGGKGPAGYDCSGLVSAAFKSIGVYVPPQTDAIRASIPSIPQTSVQRGDLVEPTEGHVVLWCGDGTVIEAQTTGVPVGRFPAAHIGAPGTWAWAGRACLNGGPDPTAPFNPPESMGPGTPPSALEQVAGASGVGSSGSQEGIARNLFGYFFRPDQFATQIAAEFTGKRAFITGQPLLQMVQAVASAGLRSWSSGPDGSFIAWYPDYWGLDGKPAVLRLEDIELTDVSINYSDDPLTTHVYVNGDMTMMAATPDPVAGWLNTAGIATVEDPDKWLYQRLIQIAPSDEQSLTGDEILRRYGVRPMKQTFSMAGRPELEFLLSCKIFMEKWAQQYQTTISMTFMPELFPGMRVELAGKNLQVYVSQVMHTCDYENGFHTQAVIMAPSVPIAGRLMSNVTTAVGPSEEVVRAFTTP